MKWYICPKPPYRPTRKTRPKLLYRKRIGRQLARGEINFKDIQVIVNGKETWPSCSLHGSRLGSSTSAESTPSPSPPPSSALFSCLFVFKDTHLLGLPQLWGLSVQFWNVLHYLAAPEICPVLPNKFFLVLHCYRNGVVRPLVQCSEKILSSIQASE